MLRQSLCELSKLCTELLYHIHTIVNEKHKEALQRMPQLARWQIVFTRKELQERSGWSRWHLEEHIAELERSGYIAYRMGRKGQRYCYSLIDESLPVISNVIARVKNQ